VTQSEILKICKMVNNGARLLVGRDYVGNARLKVVRGPFGLFVSRYVCNTEDLVKLQASLARMHEKKSGSKFVKRELKTRAA
jgi:hypothetical protein